MGLFRKLKKPDPEAEDRLFQEIEENGGLEKNDMKAMIIAGLLVIMPVAIVVMAVIVIFALLFV